MIAKRTNDPQGLRNRLLDAAADAFQTGGYHGTSIQDVMHAAETTGGALHHHFPTKKDLGLAVIRERVARAVAETWIEPVKHAKRTSDGILAAFRAVISELEAQNTVRGCPLNNLALELSLDDADFRAAVQEIFDGWRAAIAERLRADQEAGKFRAVDADAFALFVVAAYSGAIAMAKAEQSTRPLETCARQLEDVMDAAKGKGRKAHM